MAEELDFGVSGAQIASSLSNFTTTIMYVLYAALILFLLWVVWFFLSFKIKIFIRQQTNSGYYLMQTKARQYKNKSGVLMWQFLKGFQRVSPPPEGYLEMTKRGKFSASCDRNLDGSIIWRKVSINPRVPDTFTAEERTLLIHQFRESEAYKKRKLSEVLLSLAPIMAIVMILVIFMIFFGEAVAPTMELGRQNSELASSNSKLLALIEDVCLDRQTLIRQQTNNSIGSGRVVPN